MSPMFEYKKVLPIQIMKMRIIQLAKLLAYFVVSCALIILLVHYFNMTNATNKFEYVRIFAQKRLYRLNASLMGERYYIGNKPKKIMLIDDISQFKERDFYCVNSLVRCSGDNTHAAKTNVCPYVPKENLGK